MLKRFRFKKEELKEFMIYSFIVALSVGLLYFAVTFEPTPWLPDIRQERIKAEKHPRKGVKNRDIPLMEPDEADVEAMKKEIQKKVIMCNSFCKEKHQNSYSAEVIGKLKIDRFGNITCFCLVKESKQIEI